MMKGIDKNNVKEIEKAIYITNQHIKERVESYIHFYSKPHEIAAKINKDTRLTLSYDYDSCEINCIEFIGLYSMHINSINMDDINFISIDYDDNNILESLSFYFKENVIISIEFSDREIFKPTIL